MEDKKQATKSSAAKGWGLFAAGFVGALVVGWLLFPLVLYGSKPQPIAFNHPVHVKEFGGDCGECHGIRADGTFVGIPRLAKCLECHTKDEPYKTKKKVANEKVFVEQYLLKGREIPWRRYFEQPDCVYFPHVAHTKLAKLKCQVCHGDWGKLTKLPPYEYNRLTGVSRRVWGNWIGGGFRLGKVLPSQRMKMVTCQQCHTKTRKGDTRACFPCHK